VPSLLIITQKYCVCQVWRYSGTIDSVTARATVRYDRSYADILRDRMQNRREGIMSTRTLAKLTGLSYEHLRKLLQGQPIVTKSVNQLISKHLDLNEERLWTIAQRERMIQKFGESVTASVLDGAASDPLLSAIANIHGANRNRLAEVVLKWLRLDREDQQRIIAMVDTWADPAAKALDERFGPKK
jgi:hypothetical protein